MDTKSEMWYDPKCGAVLCSKAIPGVTQCMGLKAMGHYGMPHIFGETILESAAPIIAEKFDFEYKGRIGG